MTNEEYREKIKGEDDCPICGWSADTINTETHKKRCHNWQRATSNLGYEPMVRTEARELMQDARETLEDADSDKEKFDANIKLARALYDRSLGLSIDDRNHHDHPSFNEYVAMLDIPEFGAKIRERFPYEGGHIAPGYTLWEPPGSKERKIQFRMAKRNS